eukprot:2261746-Lingulodinium_polyedra.AAC.1
MVATSLFLKTILHDGTTVPAFPTRPMPSRPLRWPSGPAAELSCNHRLGRSSTTTADKKNPLSGPTPRLPRTSQ